MELVPAVVPGPAGGFRHDHPAFHAQPVGAHGVRPMAVRDADEAARNSAQYVRVAAIVNASVLIALAGAWLGFGITLVLQTWKFLQHVRHPARQQARTTPLEVQ